VRRVRRFASILLLASFLVLGSGLLERVHNLVHEHQDAAVHSHEGSAPAPTSHDETDCFLHSLLRAPVMSAGWVPLLVCLGLFVAFLTQLADWPTLPKLLSRLDCRGPPARLLNPT
jgi:hypothetical protein